MKIEAVDFFYLSMPEVHDIGDGSQDACLVRVRAGGLTGWRMRSRATAVDRRVRVSHVAQRLQAGSSFSARTID